MLRFAVLASCLALVPACRISIEGDAPVTPADASMIDAAISPSCQEAVMHSDLAWIEDNVFKQSCIFSGCHNGANSAAGRVDLRFGNSHQSLVDVDSAIDPTRKLVVAGAPDQSYLLMMIKHIAPDDMAPPASPPPANIGYMPQNAGGATMCIQKREAIERWIEAGAPST